MIQAMANVNSEPVPPLGPQPNFAALKEGYQKVGTELGKFANLPPLAQGNAILNQIHQLQHQILQSQVTTQQQLQQFQQTTQQQLQHMQQAIQQVGQDLNNFRGEFITRQQAAEYNSIARLENSAAGRSNHPLAVMRDPTTNVDIQNFPTTPEALANMTPVVLDPVLRSLGLAVNGTPSMKRQRLRIFIGLSDIPQ